MKNPETSWKPIVSVVENTLLTKIQVSGKPNKIDSCFFQIVLFGAGKKSTFIKNNEIDGISND